MHKLFGSQPQVLDQEVVSEVGEPHDALAGSAKPGGLP